MSLENIKKRKRIEIKDSVDLSQNKYSKQEQEHSLKNIQERANYQGNYCELFLEKLNNPEFKNKLVDMIIEYEKGLDLPKKSIKYTDDEYGDVVYLSKREILEEHKKKIKERNRENILKELDKNIQKVFSYTTIEVDSKNSRAAIVDDGSDNYDLESIVGFLHPEFLYTDKNLTAYQKNIVEAHEKGHLIRSFDSQDNRFSRRLLSGFDFSKIIINKYFIDILRDMYIKSFKNINNKYVSINIEDINIPNDKYFIDMQISYFKNPNEIIERMAQLRNYFGMKYKEEFTREHLDYIREHYSKDTGFYLQIQPFLQAITKDTEKRFLELINELPI